jgi:2Fe-2S ferredoxin
LAQHQTGVSRLPRLTFLLPDGTARQIEGRSGSLMELARNAGIPGILGECGGACACGTCHVHLGADALSHLGPATPDEANILDFEDSATPASRLACQIDIATLPDDLTFRLSGAAP